MATDDSTLLPFSSRVPSGPHAPDDYELPKPISDALWKQQERIFEALGVAKMLAYFVRDPPDEWSIVRR